VNNCDQFREMYEAYALGALDAADSAAFEAHLATGCKTCAKAVEEARWVVSQLAYLSTEAAPSDMLKGRLMQTVRAEAQAAKKSAAATSKPIPAWMWVGVAAMLIVTVMSAWDAQKLQKQVQELQDQAALEQKNLVEREREVAMAQREAIILTDPASVKLSLAGTDPQLPKMDAVWHAKLGIVLIGQKIAPLPGNRVLQLWLIPKAAGGKPIPSLVVRPDAEGKFELLVANPPELMAATKALAITEEPIGGSQQPTTTPKWVGGVS
jgi:Anti-sigma-K factor rskA, C-terminal/Putative zinc-finger